MSRAGRALLLALAAVLPGCALFGPQVAPPHVQLAGLEVVDGTLFEQRLHVELRVLNPNDFDLPLDGLRFELRVEDDVVARGVSNETLTVPRLGDALVPVTAYTSSVAMLRQLLAPPERGTWRYVLEGEVFLVGLGPRRAAFERSGEVPIEPLVGAVAP